MNITHVRRDAEMPLDPGITSQALGEFTHV